MAGIPQVITEDRASGAQVIDGSLTINGSNQYLTRTHTTSNTKTWTFSCWVKKQRNAAYHQLFTGFSTGANQSGIIFMNDDTLQIYSQGGLTMTLKTSAVYRDSGWMNVVVAVDTTISSPSSDRVKLWVNGTRVTSFGTETYPSQNDQTYVNQNITHYVGSNQPSSNTFYGQYAQAYFIDGQALEPTEFGFTDPLTNTWRPKKYEGDFKIIPDNQLLYNVNTGDNGFDSGTSSRTYDATGRTFTTYTTPQTANPGGNGANSAHVYKSPDGAAIDWVISTDTTDRYIWTSTDGVNWTNTGVQDTDGSPQTVNTAWLALAGGSNASNVTVTSSTAGYGLIVGHNSFYLPMDGNTPIGKDQSGVGNDWTPVNFNCTVPLNKATGAIPILQTDGSGGTAITGRDGNTVRTLRSSDKIVTASGGKYYIDGVETPTLNLIRGAYYIFDNSPGASSHPFKFSTTPDGTHNGGSAWTDGIQEDTYSGYERTRFFVPHTAPDTMYYYCSSHSGMGSQVNVTTDVLKSDPYAWKNILAIPYFRLDESHSVNEYESRHSVSEAGDPTIENIGNFYYSSFALDGNGDYVHISDSSEFSMGTDDFTLEMWIYPKSTHNGKLVFAHTSGGDYGWANLYFSNGQLELYCSSNGSSWISGLGPLVIGTPKVNEWSHVAVTRSGNTFRVFHNGMLTGTATSSASLMNSTGQLQIGARNGTANFTGNFQDLRIYKGVAKYTEDFTVGSTNPDILLDTPSGISYKTNLDKIEQGSISFNGTSDYLVIPASEDFNFEENDWTIEMYVYFEDFNQEMTLIDWSNNGASTGSPAGRLFLDHDAYGGYLQWYKDSTVVGVAYRTHVKEREWHHISWHRDAPEQSGQQNAMRIVVDGKHASGTSQGTNNVYGTSAGDLWIGRDTAGNYFKGKISNLRITKGTCVYPDTASGFVDGPQPLTALANTKLLCCKSSTVASAAEVAPGTFVNNGTNYSSGGQVTGSSGLSFVDSLFDGRLRASGASAGDAATVSGSSDNYILWTPTTGIPYSSKVEVYCYAPNGYEITNYYSFNGGSETTFTGGSSNFNGNNWITVATGSGTINSIKLRITRGSGQSTSVHWYAVRVDGTVLINDYSGKAIARFGAGAGTFNPFVGDDINVLQGQETGYATWNPLKMGTSDVSMSEGNLFWRTTSNGPDRCTYSTIGMDSGKFYWENEIVEATATAVGIANGLADQNSGPAAAHNWMYYSATGQVYLDGSASSYSDAYNTNGTIIGVAFDRDNLTLEFYKNGESQGKLTSISGLTDSETYFAMCGDSGGASQSQVRVNFGQKPFKFPPPDGFQPLNLSNVQPEKVITRPDKYVGVSLWSGNGTSQNITGLKHKPDFVWIKKRAGGTARSHQLFDSVRGVYQTLHSNSAGVEDTNTNRLTAFNQDGFAVGGDDGCNGSSGTFVGWTWKAGGNNNLFNIDDEGYLNASDVNMNEGTLNSSFYNDSEVWSTTGTLTVDLNGSTVTNINSPLSNVFEGSLASSSMCTEGTAYTNGTKTYTYTFGTAQTNITSARVYLYQGNSAEGGAAGFGNGTVNKTQNGTYGWVDATSTIPSNGTVTAMTMTTTATSGVNSARNGFIAIELNGKILLDDGITPIDNFPSIAPTGCSVNTKSKFGIYTYTGSGSGEGTLSHGLEGTPGLIIYKKRNSSSSWQVYHQSLGGTVYNTLDEDVGDYTSDSTRFGGTNPTSSIITLGTHANGADDTIMYAWCDVPGLQKFGSWTGINSTNGTFVELGFRPSLVIAKESSATGSGAQWFMLDSSRNTYNPLNNILDANRENAERQGVIYDFLSNGFKIRTTFNSGATFIYMAWAEAPSINLYGAQANAR